MAPSRRGRTLAVANSSNHGPAVLPLYQPLSNPLNQEAQHELRNLHKTHRLDGLKSHLSKANERLVQAAGDVSVCYLTNSIMYEKRKARRLENKENDEDNAQDANEDTRMITKMKSNTESMLKSLEEQVMKTIDAKASVEEIEAALKGLDALAPNGQGANAPTQSTLGVSQPRDKRRQRGSDSSGSESDHEHDPSQIQPPLNVLKRKINQFHSEYDNLSMRDRWTPSNAPVKD